MPAERIDTLVIGGGQAGLVMSYRLKQRGIAHLVLERARIAERWRSERWDGLKFQFPNWSVQLPDFAFPHTDPDAFASTGEIVDFLDAFAAFVAPPIRSGVEVISLKRGNDGFIAMTPGGIIKASNVVVATGPYQRAVAPDLLRGHPVFQVHASGYRNPGQLPSGAVLVVGAGASGAQIADELNRAGRRVFLAVGQHTRMPRRYRGRDLTWWFAALRLFDMTAEQRGPIRVNPSITGAYGGYTIDFRRFAADGVTLLGRVQTARDGVLDIAPGLAGSIAAGDVYYAGFLDMLDAHVEQHGLHLPDDPAARAVLADPPCLIDPIRRLDLGQEKIHAVVWATGYGVDFSWIDLPVRNGDGEPLHRDGISEVPGLYFLGLPYLSKLYSAFLSGVGDDAAVLADHIAARR
ncbi:MAG: NAD(P)-binding domain-containing protein [Rhizobiales bacterium]|nr:NAD(P)-binding domain-containing protein [Hyphomicrobiales bacterium]